MSRYYDLTLTDPASGKVLRQWSSHPNGQFDPAALNVTFDAPVTVGATPVHQPTIIVEGISLQDISNAQQFAAQIVNGRPVGGTNLTLKAGMKAGLPLANPAQAGLLIQGFVFQSWGNWIGTDMSLSLVVVPTIYRYNKPGNFVFNWQPGQKLADALRETLSVAFPNTPIDMRVSDALVASRRDIHYCATFDQLAAHINQLTGAQMAVTGNKIVVFDGSTEPPIALLQFTDLVGQPTWIGFDQIQVKTVLRGDIQVGNYLTFPVGFEGAPGFVTTQHAAFPSYGKYQSAIQGKFVVQQARHIGAYRNPDGNDWVSIFNCAVVP